MLHSLRMPRRLAILRAFNLIRAYLCVSLVKTSALVALPICLYPVAVLIKLPEHSEQYFLRFSLTGAPQTSQSTLMRCLPIFLPFLELLLKMAAHFLLQNFGLDVGFSQHTQFFMIFLLVPVPALSSKQEYRNWKYAGSSPARGVISIVFNIV